MTKLHIIKIRKSLKITQPTMAQILGVHPLTISKWERGILTPNGFQMSLLHAFNNATLFYTFKKNDIANWIGYRGITYAIYRILLETYPIQDR